MPEATIAPNHSTFNPTSVSVAEKRGRAWVVADTVPSSATITRASRLPRARLFPVHEQEPAWRIELRFARSRQNLQLQLVDRVLGTVPAGDREVAVPPRAREQHHVHHRVVGHERAVLVQVPERPQCHGAVDRRHQRRVHGGVAMVVQPEDHTAVHTPLVPTINSAVALRAFGHLYKNGALVTDNAMVHVMLLSRTRRDGD